MLITFLYMFPFQWHKSHTASLSSKLVEQPKTKIIAPSADLILIFFLSYNAGFPFKATKNTASTKPMYSSIELVFTIWVKTSHTATNVFVWVHEKSFNSNFERRHYFSLKASSQNMRHIWSSLCLAVGILNMVYTCRINL